MPVRRAPQQPAPRAAARPRRGGAVAAARRSPCPVAGVLDLLGDRWTLLVVRDLFLGKKRFGEFLASPEGIPTNLLADRLARLERGGVVVATPYQERPRRWEYALTDRGRALRPALRALVHWGLEHLPGTKVNEAAKRAGA